MLCALRGTIAGGVLSSERDESSMKNFDDDDSEREDSSSEDAGDPAAERAGECSGEAGGDLAAPPIAERFGRGRDAGLATSATGCNSICVV